jgi:hypothetical protein
MSLTQIPEHFQTQFGDNWTHVLQQKESRLSGKVRRETINGKERTFSRLGKSKMRLITTRNGTTIPSDTALAKRWCRLKGYDEVTYIDEFDSVMLGTLPAPQSEHVQSHAMAALRQFDETIVAGLEGTSYIGESGTTAVDLGSGQKVAVDYVTSGVAANSGLTLGKLTRAKYILDKAEVPAEGRTLAHTAKQLQDLLVNVVEVKSSDYNNVKALVDGNVNRFMGFDFVMLELLTLDAATDIRTCIAFHRDSIVLGVGSDKKVKIDERADLSHTIQVRTTLLIGSARLEEEGVVLIYTDESP